jgi:peptide chain release factor 1
MGCGEGSAIRLMLAATGKQYGQENIGILASTGCNSVFGATYPYNPYKVSWANSLFENAPTFAMGVRLKWDQRGWNDKRLWVLGGDGATLFAAELFRAYGKYAENLGLSVHVVSSSKSEVGGFKEIVFEVNGKGRSANGPYSYFKYESGVHRVQRVPETEKAGRVHTSTITVAVLPEVEEKDFQIDPKDLKIEATTSSGHGGQSVNTTYSAIRIVHIPTGITAQCQDERSQAQNKEKALEVIRARVSAHYREIEESKLKEQRRGQIGTGDRSEKIRTYNFPQDRITDHRINQNFNQIYLIMEGKLDDIVNALKLAELNLKKESLAE